MTKAAKHDVFVELCVQREYLDPHSPRRCLNAEQITLAVKHMMAFARLVKVPVLSCIDAFPPNTVDPEFLSFSARVPPQLQKAAFTLLPDHRLIDSDNSLSMSLDVLSRVQQAIFTKVHRDPFTNPKLDRLLTEMPAGRFVIFGVPLETSLRTLVLGLIRRKRNVLLISDASGYWNWKEAEMVTRQLEVKGCTIQTSGEYISAALRQFARRMGLRVRRSRSVA